MLRPNESWLPATWLHALSPHGRRFLPNGRLSRDAKEGTDGHFRLIVFDQNDTQLIVKCILNFSLKDPQRERPQEAKIVRQPTMLCKWTTSEHIGNRNGSIYWNQTLNSHESKQRRSYMFSAGSASFLITCTVLSVLLPPTPEHKTRPLFGFSSGLGSLHLGHPYKMLCLVHLTL